MMRRSNSMVQPSSPEGSASPSVISNRYITSEATSLAVEKSAAGEYTAKENEISKFKISPCGTFLQTKLELLDERGNRIALLKPKHMTLHGRCQVYRCNSTGNSNRERAFSISKPRVGGNFTDLHVTLENTRKDIDFKISLNRTEGTWHIYEGDGQTIIAHTLPTENEDKLEVKVEPNVDCAFVVFLIAAVKTLSGPGTQRDIVCAAVETVKTVGALAATIAHAIFEAE